MAWVWRSCRTIAPHLASGALVRVLEDWCAPFLGFFLYYPVNGSYQRHSRRSSKPCVCSWIEHQKYAPQLLIALIVVKRHSGEVL